MRFSLLFTSAAVLCSQLVIATPFANSSQEFYLKSVVISGPKRFGNLHPWSYHTGAGTSVPALLEDKDGSVKSYFNNTRLNVDLGGEYPWGWVPGFSTYSAWSDVELNAGIGSEGFSINNATGRNVVFEKNDWVACDWAFGKPQLFYYNSLHTTPLPCSCAKIKLVPEYI